MKKVCEPCFQHYGREEATVAQLPPYGNCDDCGNVLTQHPRQPVGQLNCLILCVQCIEDAIAEPTEPKRVLDKDGNPLSPEEEREYTDDVFDGGIPMSAEYVREYLWPKWGVRLGIPKPE